MYCILSTVYGEMFATYRLFSMLKKVLFGYTTMLNLENLQTLIC